MAQISPDYASPGLRLGLLLHDHPDATYSFELKSGAELGIPDAFGGAGNFCIATISFGDGRADASAWKPAPAKGDADQWNVLQTKTLGRALKKAGYPDDLKDLKALVLWRQRSAEIAAIESGTQQVAIAATTSRAPQAALGSGSKAAPVAPDEFDQALDAAGVAESDDVDSIEVVGVIDIDDDRLATIQELVEGLDGRTLSNYNAYLAQLDAPNDPTKFTDSQLDDVLAWLDPAGD